VVAVAVAQEKLVQTEQIQPVATAATAFRQQ
jgi:hypothetical protein